MCKGGRVFRPPFLLHRREAFYCTLGGLANRSDAKTNRPRLRVAEGVHKWIVWAYLLQRAPRLGSAVPLIGRNNMKKKLLLAPLMAVLVACVVVLSGCGGPSVEELITEDLTTQFDEVKNGGDDFLSVWRRLRATSSSSWVSIPRSMPRPISRALTTRSAT